MVTSRDDFLDQMILAQAEVDKARAEVQHIRELLVQFQQTSESAVALASRMEQMLQQALEPLLHFRQRAHTFTEDPEWIACGWAHVDYVNQADRVLADAKAAGFKVTVRI